MKTKSIFIDQIGDTMIEVLIAIAVLSTILGGAYRLASGSLINAREAQERVEALKLAEGQVERLRYAARVNNDFDTIFRSNNFCIDANATRKINLNPSGNNYNTECSSTGPPYKLNITYNDPFSSPDNFGNFEIKAVWDGLHGRPENLVINYQL